MKVNGEIDSKLKDAHLRTWYVKLIAAYNGWQRCLFVFDSLGGSQIPMNYCDRELIQHIRLYRWYHRPRIRDTESELDAYGRQRRV